MDDEFNQEDLISAVELSLSWSMVIPLEPSAVTLVKSIPSPSRSRTSGSNLVASILKSKGKVAVVAVVDPVGSTASAERVILG